MLWTNPSPSASFSSQTVSLDFSKYDGVIIEFYPDTASSIVRGRSLLFKNDVDDIGVGLLQGGASYKSVSRQCNLVSDGVHFYAASVNGSYDNSRFIPAKIYGINLQLE